MGFRNWLPPARYGVGFTKLAASSVRLHTVVLVPSHTTP